MRDQIIPSKYYFYTSLFRRWLDTTGKTSVWHYRKTFLIEVCLLQNRSFLMCPPDNFYTCCKEVGKLQTRGCRPQAINYFGKHGFRYIERYLRFLYKIQIDQDKKIIACLVLYCIVSLLRGKMGLRAGVTKYLVVV